MEKLPWKSHELFFCGIVSTDIVLTIPWNEFAYNTGTDKLVYPIQMVNGLKKVL